MTLHQLKIFLAVSRYSSITKASQELRISEPSTYQQLKSLQTSIGLSLYKRIGRGIELTHEGRTFCRQAGEVLEKLRQLEERFGVRSSRSEAASLAVGGSHAPSASMLTSLLAKFKKTHPDVQVTLCTKSSPIIERLILKSELDIGLVTNPSHSIELAVEPYRQETMVIIAAHRHALARKKELTLAELARGPLIIRERVQSKSRRILEQVEQQGFQPNILMRCDSAHAVKAAVMSGLGVGILHRDHVHQEVKRGELKVLKVRGLKKVHFHSFIIYKTSSPLSPTAATFLEFLRQVRPAHPQVSRAAEERNTTVAVGGRNSQHSEPKKPLNF